METLESANRASASAAATDCRPVMHSRLSQSPVTPLQIPNRSHPQRLRRAADKNNKVQIEPNLNPILFRFHPLPATLKPCSLLQTSSRTLCGSNGGCLKAPSSSSALMV